MIVCPVEEREEEIVERPCSSALQLKKANRTFGVTVNFTFTEMISEERIAKMGNFFAKMSKFTAEKLHVQYLVETLLCSAVR